MIKKMPNRIAWLEIQDDLGRELACSPDRIRPMGVEELLILENDKEARLCVYMDVTDPACNGRVVEGEFVARVPFSCPAYQNIFALIPGGWLPLFFTVPRMFVVDRNVVSDLRKVSSLLDSTNGIARILWTQIFASGSAIFHPYLYAFESSHRRAPTFGEFLDSYREAVDSLRLHLPNSDVVQYDAGELNSIYNSVRDLYTAQAGKLEFLRLIGPVLTDRIAQGSEAAVVADLIGIAKQVGINRKSLTFIAALACIYEDPHGKLPSIGRKLLKPKRNYSQGDAHNAFNDLHHIYQALTMPGLAPNGQRFALCTSDRAVAMFWSALLPQQSPDGGLTCTPSKCLFPRLDERGFQQLLGVLAA